MIHDLELETVVDVQGILTPVFTENDKDIIDAEIEALKLDLINYLINEFEIMELQSSKLAIIEMARRLNADSETLKLFIKKYQDEL